uniref:Uncharacterized protein n=1 Tax=Peromyscus maniculatus bairdii TaxID=230844 RepID=A0A8C8UI15_PERMB
MCISLSVIVKYKKETAICKLERMLLPSAGSAGTFILNFLAFRIMRNINIPDYNFLHGLKPLSQ